MPASTHLVARDWHTLADSDLARAKAFGREAFDAFFVRHEDITNEETVVELCRRHDMTPDVAIEAMKGAAGRAGLEAMIGRAVADRVCGSPYFVLDGEGFFGVDRLPQLRWRLSPQGQDAMAASSNAAP